MAEPILRIQHGDDHFDLKGLMALEMSKVKRWTEDAVKNRDEFYAALRREDPDAYTAAFMIAAERAGGKPRWEDIAGRLDLDATRAFYVDVTGREIEIALETDSDGKPLLIKVSADGKPVKDKNGYVPDPKNGRLIARDDGDGNLIWQYADTKEPVPPTTSVETTTSPDTKPTSTEPSATASGTPTTDG